MQYPSFGALLEENKIKINKMLKTDGKVEQVGQGVNYIYIRSIIKNIFNFLYKIVEHDLQRA